MEDNVLRDQLQRYNDRLREFEERSRNFRGAAVPTHPERGGAGGNGNSNNGSGGGGTHGQSLEVMNFNRPTLFQTKCS